MNCFRNFSGASGQAIRIRVSLSCVIPTVDSDVACSPAVAWLCRSPLESLRPSTVAKPRFKCTKSSVAIKTQAIPASRLAVKGRDENPTSCSRCAIASRLAK